MIATYQANETNTLAGTASSNTSPTGLSLAAATAPDAAVELEDLDDGVEAQIVCMDPTTVEHLFLQARRQV